MRRGEGGDDIKISLPSFTAGAPSQLGTEPGTETSTHFPSCKEKNFSSQGWLVPGQPWPQSPQARSTTQPSLSTAVAHHGWPDSTSREVQLR